MKSEAHSKGQVRREQIMLLLKQQGRITVHDIVARFGCSEATARRDLEALERTEPIIRTIGGAMYDGFSSAREVSFLEKRSISWYEKEAIARKAASFVQEGDIIGLSGGTTTFMIAKELKQKAGITVVTNAVNIAMELSDCEDIQIVVTGGIMRNKSFELCGPLAEKMVEGLNIGKMFLGIDGVTGTHGLTTYSESEAEIAKMLIKRSAETYAVFDHSKVGRTSLFTIVPISSVDSCITDQPVGDELSQALREHNIALHIAEGHALSLNEQ